MLAGNATIGWQLVVALGAEDCVEMSSESVRAFNDRVAASPELQAQLGAVTSPLDFLALAKAEGFDLGIQDFQMVVQQAYQQWLDRLSPTVSKFFSQVRNEKELDDRLKICQSSAEAIALAQQCGVELSAEDLQQAATVAASIPGFSFEKLWFRRLGLM
jgi:predicted ribosomally synthesized peptide with nif11-like leader